MKLLHFSINDVKIYLHLLSGTSVIDTTIITNTYILIISYRIRILPLKKFDSLKDNIQIFKCFTVSLLISSLTTLLCNHLGCSLFGFKTIPLD